MQNDPDENSMHAVGTWWNKDHSQIKISLTPLSLHVDISIRDENMG